MKSIMGANGCEVTVGLLTFNHVHSISIDSSWQTLNDVCTIKLPNQADMQEAIEQMPAGAEVVVKLGYDGGLHVEFEGYVKSVSSSHPYTIECWDGMYKLAQEEVTQSWETTTLKDVVEYLVADATVGDIPAVTLSPFKLNRITKAQALQKLKDEYGLVAYFRGTKLYVGLAYYEANLPQVVYRFDDELANAKADRLEFKREDDIKLKVKAISIMPDNTKIEVDLGDADGELRTLHFYDKTKAELEVLAKDKLDLLKFEGYRGSLMAKGLPRPVHGQVAKLFSPTYPQREGRYFCDRVHTTFNGSTGFTRRVHLGRKSNSSI